MTQELQVCVLLDISGTDSYTFRLEYKHGLILLKASKEYYPVDLATLPNNLDHKLLEVPETFGIHLGTQVLCPEYPGADENGKVTLQQMFDNPQLPYVR